MDWIFIAEASSTAVTLSLASRITAAAACAAATAASAAAAVASAIAKACFFCSFSTSNAFCTACGVVAICSVQIESFGAADAAVADDLRKLHLLFSFGVVCRLEIGVVGLFSMAMQETWLLGAHFSLSFFPVKKLLSHLPVFPIFIKSFLSCNCITLQQHTYEKAKIGIVRSHSVYIRETAFNTIMVQLISTELIALCLDSLISLFYYPISFITSHFHLKLFLFYHDYNLQWMVCSLIYHWLFNKFSGTTFSQLQLKWYVMINT